MFARITLIALSILISTGCAARMPAPSLAAGGHLEQKLEAMEQAGDFDIEVPLDENASAPSAAVAAK